MIDIWLTEARKRKLVSEKLDCFRLVDENTTAMRIDRLGEVVSFQWYGETPVGPDLLEKVTLFTHEVGLEHWVLRQMLNRGKNPTEKTLYQSDKCPQKWIGTESGVKFEFRTDSGQSPGLFLDQRERREWLRGIANGKRVLNLFCYTGGFSVFAALGGAQTISVDVSENYLDWTKQNFALNHIDISHHEFWKADSLDFLEGASRRGRKFDIVVCDPPSFGRSKRGVFSLAKDYKALLLLSKSVLEANGILIFSTNFETWSESDFSAHMQKFSRDAKLTIVDLPKAPAADFNSNLLKTCIFKN